MLNVRYGFFGQIVMAIAMVTSLNVAADITCRGKVEFVMIGDWHGVYVKTSWHDTKIRMCDLDGGFGAVPASICKEWLPTLQAAVMTGGDVGFFYDDYNDDIACESLPGNSGGNTPASMFIYSPGYGGPAGP